MPKRRLFGVAEKQAVMDLFDQAMIEGSHVMAYNGEQEQAYCKEWVDFMGGGFADAVNSGTSAVYVALAALELEAGTEVIVPAVTDPGGCMPVSVLNLIPIPADTAEDYFTINAKTIAEKITDKTGAIIVAHIGGRPADMESIMALANEHNLPVIEDCAQNHGGTINGKRVGSFGTISAFSLMWSKQHASGGQGGMVYTKDEALYWKIRSYADRGKPFGVKEPHGNINTSLNLNMDAIHASIGRVQLKKLPSLVRRSQELSEIMARKCEERLQHFRVVTDPPWGENTYWMMFLRVDNSAFKISLNQVYQELAAEGMNDCWSFYSHVPMRMPWAVKKYGPCPELPNCTHVINSHLLFDFNEQYAEQDLEDLISVLERLEKDYAL